MNKYFRFPWALGSYLVLGIIVLRGALALGFLCDDTSLILNSQGNWFRNDLGLIPQLFTAQKGVTYQLFVVQYALLDLFYKTFQLNPLPYHALHLGLVIINAGLVYLLAQTLGFEPWKCWVAGLLALFNSVASEAYFWISVFNTVLMTGCTLTGLIFLSRFRLGGSFSWGLGYLFIIILAPAVESKGVMLPLLGVFLDLYLVRLPAAAPKKRTFLAGWRLQALAFGLTGLIILGRHLLGIKHFVIRLPLEEKWFTFKATIVSTFFHGLDDHLWPFLNLNYPLWENLRSWMLLAILAMIIVALVKMGKMEKRLFFSLLLLWLGASLPHVLVANWQYRYFYFPGVFAALVVAELLGFLHRRYAGKAGLALISLLVLGYLYLDLTTFQLSLASFSEASQIYDAGIHRIKERLPHLPPNSHLILIDFPDYILSRQNQGPQRLRHFYYVYIYNYFLPAHLVLLYNTRQFSVTYLSLTPTSDENMHTVGEPASREQVAGLMARPQTYAFRYLGGNPPRFISWENQ